MTSRREFIRSSAAGAAALWSTDLTLPGFLSRSAHACAPESDTRILVVVQLTGGNDGLNTVIPFAHEGYRRVRPTLRIAPERVYRLTDDLGLHPEMEGLARLHDDGLLGVVTNVGYPNPERSHFRSLDIWHTAQLTPEDPTDGWLGRAAEHMRVDGDAAAMHIDAGPLPLALRSERVAVPSLDRVDALRLPPETAAMEEAIAAARPGAADNLLYVQRVAVSACRTARRLATVADAGSSRGYPQFGLAQRLRGIADLVAAGVGARVYYTGLGGFDTHARQADTHGPLLRELSDSIKAFYDDLRTRQLADRVVLMTFSEFGRRVAENGSRGTDHGAAAPLFVVGPACTPGVIGGPPNLDHLVDGDVRHDVDFRAVYSTLLARWLSVDPVPVLGRRYETVGVV